jgi:cyclase
MARRIALTGILLWGVTCAHKPTQPPFTLKQTSSHAWAAIDNSLARPPAGSNAGFVIGNEGAVVIDTFFNVDAAQQLLGGIRRTTNLPIKYVINTHYHMDHVSGNGVFAATGAVLLAHRNVRDWIHSETLRMMTDGAAAAHVTLSPEQTAAVSNLVAPTVVYDDTIDLQIGSRLIQVHHLPGHTGSDSVIVIPDEKVIFCGDLFWNHASPNLIDASTKPWIDTLTNLASSYEDYLFVPGHGDIGHVRDVVAFRDYLSTLRQLIADAQAGGVSANAIVDVVQPQLSAKYGEWAYFNELGPPNIMQTDAELRGTKRIPPRAAEQQR